tara:strand:- start:1793 stop:2338 length:546 start_codon:yes stop_codon:yes gene_type:complete
MVNVQLRPAQLNDARDIAVVHVDAWRAAYEGLLPPEMLDALRTEGRAARWSRWIESSLSGNPTDGTHGPSHRLLLAEVDGRAAGWATFGGGRDDGMTHLGELAGLYVHPDYWSQKIGHALLERVDQELRAEGWNQAYLWVLRGNARAIRFYEEHGWHADGDEKVVDVGGTQLHELRHLRQL